MRQQLQTDESLSTRSVPLSVPSANTTVAIAAPTARLTVRGQSKATRAKKARVFRPGRILTGFLAFLLVPWCPPATPVALHIAATGPSANAFYEGISVYSGEALRTGAKPPQGISKAAWVSWRQELQERPGEHVLPQGFQPLYGLRTQEQLQRQVAKNQAALAKLPEGLSLPYTNGGIFDTRTDIGRTAVNLAVTLSNQGFLLAQAGRHREAIETALTTLALGNQLGKGGNLHAWFQGEACITQALPTLERSIPHLTPAEALGVQTRLTTLLAQRGSLVQALTGERDQVARLLAFYRYPGTEGNLLSRIPLVRLANLALVNHYEAEQNHRIALLAHPTAQTAAELAKPLPALDPIQNVLSPLDRVSANDQRQTERLAKIVALLQVHAEGTH